jgi:hypothetical protein
MNKAEYNALNTTLSNEARVLYCLYLRPQANRETGASDYLNYKSIMALLNTGSVNIKLGRQINAMLKELLKAELILLPNDTDISKSLNGKQVILPLLIVKDDKYALLHKEQVSMFASWQPDTNLVEELAQMVGLIDKSISSEDIGDFVAYWLGRPDIYFTPFQWTQKFVSHLKQRRIAKYSGPVKKVGSQLTQAASGIEADDNARKLVEKYATKQ